MGQSLKHENKTKILEEFSNNFITNKNKVDNRWWTVPILGTLLKKNKELLNISRNLKIYKKKMPQKKNRQKPWIDIS